MMLTPLWSQRHTEHATELLRQRRCGVDQEVGVVVQRSLWHNAHVVHLGRLRLRNPAAKAQKR